MIIKINIFRSDLSDISVKTVSLLVWRRSILDDSEWEHVGINTRKSNPKKIKNVIPPTNQ